jgi:hypothetical protein
LLQRVHEGVATPLQRAAEAEARAQAVVDPKLRAEYEQTTGTWHALARSYQFQQSLESFIAFQANRKTFEALNSKEDAPTQEQHLVGTASSKNESWIAVLRVRIHGIWTGEKPANLLERSFLVVLLYLAAATGRQALHLVLPVGVRYLTFFPALLAAGLLCGLAPSLILLAAFALTGIFLYDPSTAVPITIRLGVALLFAVGGAGVVIPSWCAARTHRILRAQDRRLSLLNSELRHREPVCLNLLDLQPECPQHIRSA